MDIGFISGGSGIIGLNNLYREQIMYLVKSIDELNEIADFIIIDTGAGISDRVLEFVMASPEVLLVSTPEPSSLTDSYSLLKALYRNPNFVAGSTTIHVVSNRVTSTEEGQEKAVRQQQTVSLLEPNAKSAKAFEVLAGNLLNGTHNQISMRRGIGQMFSSFLMGHK